MTDTDNTYFVYWLSLETGQSEDKFTAVPVETLKALYPEVVEWGPFSAQMREYNHFLAMLADDFIVPLRKLNSSPDPLPRKIQELTQAVKDEVNTLYHRPLEERKVHKKVFVELVTNHLPRVGFINKSMGAATFAMWEMFEISSWNTISNIATGVSCPDLYENGYEQQALYIARLRSIGDTITEWAEAVREEGLIEC